MIRAAVTAGWPPEPPDAAGYDALMADGRRASDAEFHALVAERVARPARLAAVAATRLLDTEAEAAFDRIARLAARFLGTPSGFVTLVDDQRSFWKAFAGAGAGQPTERQNGVGESFCQYVIGLDDVFLVDDARLDSRTADNPSIESMKVCAWAGAPVRSVGGEVLGTVCVVDSRPRSWSSDDAQVLRDLAEVASGEIVARSSAAAARRAQSLLDAIVERAPVGFCLVDDQLRFEMINDVLAATNGLSAQAHLGRPVSAVLSEDAGPIVEAMASIVAGRHDALEVDLQGRAPGRSRHQQAFHASYFRVDLGDGTRRVAALVSDETERAAARRRAELIAELTRRLAVADDLTTVAETVEDLACDYVGADDVTVALTDPASDRLEVITSTPTATAPCAGSVGVDDEAIAEAFRSRGLVVATGAPAPRPAISDGPSDLVVAGSAVSVVAPMRVGSGVPIGVTVFGWRHAVDSHEIDRRPIDTLVDVVTQAVERIRTSRQRRALIDGLQDLVLAAPDTRPGIELAVRYVPAAKTLGFGGDWYDVVPLDGHRTALVVGDVVGHDATAAVRMTEARALVRQLLRIETPLGELFDRAGELASVVPSSALATAVVVVVDPGERTLTAASAGHLPPILVDVHGRSSRLPIGLGPFLGVEGRHRAPVTTSYVPGSTVVCYSDGLVETRDRPIDESIDGLMRALAGSHVRSCEAIAGDLIDSFVDRQALADDVALVAARLC